MVARASMPRKIDRLKDSGGATSHGWNSSGGDGPNLPRVKSRFSLLQLNLRLADDDSDSDVRMEEEKEGKTATNRAED